MKKFFKVCLITTGILFLVGLLLCFIGNVYDGDKELEILVKDGKFGIDLDDGIFGIQQFDIADMDTFDLDFEISAGDIEKKVLAENCEEIDIEIGGGTLTFVPSEDDKVYVEATGVGKFQAYNEENEVKIKSVKTSNMIGGEITVYIPQEFQLKQLNLAVGAGEIDMTDVEIYADEIEIEVGAGMVQADYVVCGKLEVEVGAGQAILDNVTAENFEAKVGMGDITVSGDVLNSLNVECAMGNADFELTGEEEDFNYDIECAAGNISLGSSDHAGLGMDKKINNGATKNCTLECAMGNISVEFQ